MILDFLICTSLFLWYGVQEMLKNGFKILSKILRTPPNVSPGVEYKVEEK